MKKKPQTLPEDPPDFFETMRENPYFNWMIENRRSIPYVFLGILVLIMATYQFTSKQATKAETSYLLAENYLSVLQRNLQGEPHTADKEEALIKIKDITEEYPELQPRFDGLIAQLLLTQNNPEEAQKFAERNLSRISEDDLTSYSNFSKTTLLIAQEKYDAALQNALELKQTLLEEKANDALFAYNLLRIGMLQQTLGLHEAENMTWREWKQFSDATSQISIDPQPFIAINSMISEGSFTLDDYIKERENFLKSEKEDRKNEKKP